MTSPDQHESDRSMAYESQYTKTPLDMRSVAAAWVVFLIMVFGTGVWVAAKALLG